MAVTFDNTAETSTAGAASLTISNFVMGSGSNRAVIIIIAFAQATTPASLAINWNTSETLTAITGASINDSTNVDTVLAYGLVNPTSGTHSFTATWTGSVEAWMAAISVSGANQTGGTTTFAHGTSNSNGGISTTTSTITVASGVVGNMTIAGHLCGGSVSAVSDTQAWIDNGQSTYFFAGNRKASAAGNNTLTATYSPADLFDAVGFDIVASAAAAVTKGWEPGRYDEHPLPRSQMDEAKAFFRPSQIVVPTNLMLPTTGADRERLPPIQRAPDEPPGPFFLRSLVPVPTNRSLPLTGADRERLPPIQRAPDEPPGPFFIRSPSPVPTRWAPTTGEAPDRPPPIKRPPDEPWPWTIQKLGVVAPPNRWLPITGEEDRPPSPNRIEPPDEPKPFFIRSPSPVPTFALPRTGEDIERLPPIGRPPDEPVVFFRPSQVTVPVRWLPTTGEEDRLPNPNRIRAPDEPYPFFLRSLSAVPIMWLPTTGEEDRPSNPNCVEPPDKPKPFFVRSPAPVPTIALPITGADKERLPPIGRSPDESPVFFKPPAGVGISGIAWYNPSEDKERLPPVGRPPDEPFAFFTRSPVPVPITWLPTSGQEDRPAPKQFSPDQIVFIKQPVTPVPISGIAWFNPQDTPRLPPFLPDPSLIQPVPPFIEPPLIPFMAQSNADDFNPLPKPISDERGMWSPVKPMPVGISGIAWWHAAETQVDPPISRVPDQPNSFFVRSQSPVPAQWLPTTGEEDRPPPPFQIDIYRSPLILRPPAPPVGISGIAFWNRTEVYVVSPPMQRAPDEPNGWFFLYVPITPIIIEVPTGTNTYLEMKWTVAGLPPATLSGYRAFVTDSTVGLAAGLGNVPVGGGTHVVPVYTDETPKWVIG